MAVDKVHVVGLKEFTKELRKAEGEFQKEMKPIHVKVANLVAGRAKSAAPGNVSGAIKGRGTQKSAFIDTLAKPPFALVTFWGAKRRSGWYAKARYRGSGRRQHPEWVGNQWEPGSAFGKPYFIGPAINASVNDVIELIGDEVEKLAKRAFPD